MVFNDGKNTIVALHQCRAAFNPIATVVVGNFAKLADGGTVDVAAKDRIHMIAFRVMRHSGFEFADKAHRVFHPTLGISAERPVTEAEAAPDKIDERIKREQKLVTKIACEREPFHILHHSVELVTMNN